MDILSFLKIKKVEAQLADIAHYPLDQTIFTDSLVIGGGGTLISRIGVNPVDPLSFESDGSYNGLYNTFFGRKTGEVNTTGNGNTFVGSNAGKANINGDQNTFLGWYAGLENTNGYHNTFLGVGAGQENISGYFNTYIGCDCALSATGGYDNVAIGTSTFSKNQTGNDNVAIGVNVLTKNVIGTQNVAIGTYSLLNANNSQNTAVGYATLNVATGTMNTAIGNLAGFKITSGNRNVCIGASAGNNASQAATANNSIAIGYGAYTTESNVCQIGDANITKVLTHGDFETQDIGDGFVCKSPNGTRYRITISDAGALVANAA